MSLQIKSLKKGARVMIATPGRLLDHIRQGTVTLSDVRILILDEADRMFDMGFAPQVKQIIRCVAKKRQVMLFSATMPPAIMDMASQHMELPIRVEIAPSGTAAESEGEGR